jgi:hypothetical protein
MIRLVVNVTCMRKKRNTYKILLGKPEEKGPLEDLEIGGIA